MQPKERFLNALQGRPVDYVPAGIVTTAVTVAMQEQVGVYWPEAHRSAAGLASLAEATYHLTGLDGIKLPFCMTVEVEAIGARVDYRTRDTIPTEVGHLYDHPDQLHLPGEFFDRGRVPVVLSAIGALRQRYDSETPIITSIVGPFSLAAKLFGFSNFLVWLIDHPDWVHQIMDPLTDLAIRYARAQVEAGADAVIVGEASCSGSLISPAMYRDFIAPYHRRLCPAVPAPTLLHICGRSTRHLPHIAATGASAYNFDEGVDPAAARQHLNGRMALTGYVPTVQVMLNGTPEDVRRSAWECLDNGVNLLTPGCALAPNTPLENLRALSEAALEYAAAHPHAPEVA